MNDVLRTIFVSGGITVLCIALVSIFAMTVTIERCWRLLPMRRRFADVRGRFADAFLRVGSAEALASLGDDPMSRVLRAGLSTQDRGIKAVQIAATNAAQREVANIERGLGMIQLASQIGPWLGLLGTVVGLMDVFAKAGGGTGAGLATGIATIGNAQVADGIHQALGATAAGLALAIAAFSAYSLLSGVAARLIDEIEIAAADLPLIMVTSAKQIRTAAVSADTILTSNNSAQALAASTPAPAPVPTPTATPAP